MNPDPLKVAVLRTVHPCCTGSFTLPLEGTRILRVCQIPNWEPNPPKGVCACGVGC